jgi:serine/threonine protein kinase/tetratricopeptide (TPR) repeat protein
MDLIGQTISHYKILQQVGAGGMGIVYKAEDLSLTRTVALKFLPLGLEAQEPERARFLQEARAAAILNHPNICTIHEIAEVDGQQFIVMEFIDGKTLRQVAPVQQLQTALGYAVQIGEALHEAHSQGIVHRDIKADNIMLNPRGQIKVMDFGLAKLKGSLKLTRTSSTLGTLAYMAPEQLQGGEVDARSDIFSFGVVLYEMFTGKGPFRAEHEAALMYSILNEQPALLSGLRPDLPSEIDRIVQRSLEKNPEDRYQHVDDMVSELRRVMRQSGPVLRPEAPTSRMEHPRERGKGRSRKFWLWVASVVVLLGIGVALFKMLGPSPGGSSAAKKMLVVLPFENLGSANQEYFADGITEEITSRLSGLSGLGVIARSSAMQYKKTPKTVKQIGQELTVSYILQGTIRWENSGGETHVRVTPQLVSVGDGTQIWSEAFESVLSGAFKLQKEIAGDVARALDVTLLQPERKVLETALTSSPEAYDHYLRALTYVDRSFAEQDMRLAEQLLTKAVSLDPKFTAAYASLSGIHANMYWEFYDHTETRVQQAKEAADMALRLDPSHADAHVAQGMYYYHCRLDYDNALKELGEALARQPNNRDALLGIAAIKRRQGKFDESAANTEKVLETDPRSGSLNAELAITFAKLRKFPEAERYFDRAISLSPDWPVPYSLKALLYLRWNGNIHGARSVLEEAANRKIRNQDILITYAAVNVDVVEGRFEDALQRLSEMEPNQIDVQEVYFPAELLKASIYGYLKRPKEERIAYETSRQLLERASREHPDDARLHGALGLAYAGLGRKDEALREGKLAIELLPLSKDALRGSYRATELALIYVMVGEHDAALALLEDLLSRPTDLTVSILRLDPAWAPLRSNPRFQKLVGEKK